MEYDIDIKPTKLVKGHGLAKILADSNCRALGIYLVENQSMEEGLPVGENNEQIYEKYADSLWYNNLLYFLLYLQCPPDVTKSEFRSLNLRAMKYVWIG